MKYKTLVNCTPLMHLTLFAFTAMLITFASTNSQATSIAITTDTATELAGTFCGRTYCYEDDSAIASATNFKSLPFGLSQLFVRRSALLSSFGSVLPGSPNSPLVVFFNANPTSGTTSGHYTNSGAFGSQGPRVDFTITYDDTGTRNGYGTLLGTFSFTTEKVPDGGTTALLLGLGLLGFLVTHKLTRFAPQV